MKINRIKRPIIKWLFLSLLTGGASGVAATLFLVLLDVATRTRSAHPALIWFLPIAGFFLGSIYYYFGRDVAGGNNLILEEIHSSRRKLPLRMSPLVLLGTLITHLFGGSAGREGTAVQMGASLADQIGSIFRVGAEERKILLVAGAGSGFGAAIGVPWAGVIFGMEVIRVGRLRPFAVVECVIASFAAVFTTQLFKAPHTHYPSLEPISFSLKALMSVFFAGLIFGWFARLFSWLTHRIEKIEKRWISYPPMKPFVGGALIVLLYFWEGSYRYAGLGISVIQESLNGKASFGDPIYKLLFTALTVGSGFKGGEFIPLVFMGATLGSAIAQIFSLSSNMLAAVGFCAVFAAASNTPLACTIMAIELFGWGIAPFAIVGCFTAYYVSGYRGIYKSQRVDEEKHKALFSILGELPKRFLKR